VTDRNFPLLVGHERTIRRGPKPSGGWVKDGIATIGAGDTVSIPALTAPVPVPTPVRLWGMLPGFAGCDMASLRSRGVQALVVELSWASAQPSQTTYDFAYLDRKKAEWANLRSLGFKLILNYGAHHAPGWLRANPLAKFVDQRGVVYAGDEPNLIHGTSLRGYAEAYTQMVFAHMGHDFAAVRVGGGHWGELQYPPTKEPTNMNRYWSFGTATDGKRPTGDWKPGSSSPNGEAARFLAWHLDSLTAFATWQVRDIRKHFAGPIGVLLASDGMRPGDFELAVATNLSGTSAWERNGEVQPGYDHRRHILGLAALNDPLVAPWATYAESTGRGGPMTYIANEGKAAGLYPVMAENSGDDSPAQLDYAVNTFKALGGSIFTAVRGDTFCTPKPGVAVMADYERLM